MRSRTRTGNTRLYTPTPLPNVHRWRCSYVPSLAGLLFFLQPRAVRIISERLLIRHVHHQRGILLAAWAPSGSCPLSSAAFRLQALRQLPHASSRRVPSDVIRLEDGTLARIPARPTLPSEALIVAGHTPVCMAEGQPGWFLRRPTWCTRPWTAVRTNDGSTRGMEIGGAGHASATQGTGHGVSCLRSTPHSAVATGGRTWFPRTLGGYGCPSGLRA
jgi:hypothetical protein